MLYKVRPLAACIVPKAWLMVRPYTGRHCCLGNKGVSKVNSPSSSQLLFTCHCVAAAELGTLTKACTWRDSNSLSQFLGESKADFRRSNSGLQDSVQTLQELSRQEDRLSEGINTFGHLYLLYFWLVFQMSVP